MSADLEREAREAAEGFADSVDAETGGAICKGSYMNGFIAAATLREKEVEELRAGCRTMEWESAEAMALVLAYEGKIATQTVEIAALRARVAELEGMVPRWVPPHGDEIIGLASAGWSPVKHYSRPPLRAVVATLMVPPIPAPKTKP